MPSPLVIATALCVALALASLALPSGPGYDQYAWLIWGRDLAHFGLSVHGSGTSWKPLPALIDALLTPLGRGAADGWLVVARAGAVFAVFMAFRVAWRLAPPGLGLLAGLIAAASLALTHEWVRLAGTGNSEGLMVALGLLAVDRHLDGRRGQAFALLVAAGLIRVEMWPFTAAYGLWLAVRSGGWERVGLALGVLAGPLFWFGGDWLGSGRLTTASDRALRPIPGSPGIAAHPALAVLEEAYTMLPLPAWIAIAAGLITALARRRLTPLVALAGCAVAWTAVVAAMAARGYGGLPRFVFMASALDSVAAGIGAAVVIRELARRNLVAGRALALAASAAFAFGALPNGRLLPADLAGIDKVADTDAALADSVQTAGGPGSVLRCGSPTTPWYVVTAVAWDLGVAANDVHDRPSGGRPVVFRQRRGRWRVLEPRRCRLVAAQATQVRNGAAHHQRAHHRRSA
jgi:hypothetical protein